VGGLGKGFDMSLSADRHLAVKQANHCSKGLTSRGDDKEEHRRKIEKKPHHIAYLVYTLQLFLFS
jgi:hypothetical protein